MNIGEYGCGLLRYEKNPIITPESIPGAYMTFNCGQTMYKGKTILLVAVVMKNSSFPSIWIAESDNGYDFKFRDKPFIERSDVPFLHDLDTWTIDPRVTYVPEDDMYYIMRPLSSSWGCSAVLGKTKDFEKYEDIEIIALPNNRVPCLFPGKIDGKYVRLDRPYCTKVPSYNENANIWISYSTDLIHWGEHRPLLKPWILWNSNKIGPTPPIRTKKGWLEIIHGVQSNTVVPARYSIGAVLLDLKDPAKVIGKTNSPILTPDAPYEYMGTVPNVVFPCGAIGDEEKDELRLYYGAGDTYIGLATGKLSEIVDMCIYNR